MIVLVLAAFGIGIWLDRQWTTGPFWSSVRAGLRWKLAFTKHGASFASDVRLADDFARVFGAMQALVIEKGLPADISTFIEEVTKEGAKVLKSHDIDILAVKAPWQK